MKANKLMNILSILVEHDQKAEVAFHTDRLWIAEPDALSAKVQEDLTKLGAHCDPGEGWFVWL